MSKRPTSSSPIDFAAMPDTCHEDLPGLSIDLVQESVLPHPQAEQPGLAPDGFNPCWRRFALDPVDPDREAPPHILREFLEVAPGRRCEIDGVGHGL